MKRTIRYGCFETNSSSMHSIVIMKDKNKKEVEDYFYLYADGTWVIYDFQLKFGRSPFRAICGFKNKWLYACASLVKEYKDDTFNELERIALNNISSLKKIDMPTTNNCIAIKEKNPNYPYAITEEELIQKLEDMKQKFGIEEIVYWETSSGYWSYNTIYTGTVDEDILSEFLKKENISIEEFLTNDKYIVIQDGDEYEYWNDIKECGLINMDAIDHEYPKGE